MPSTVEARRALDEQAAIIQAIRRGDLDVWDFLAGVQGGEYVSYVLHLRVARLVKAVPRIGHTKVPRLLEDLGPIRHDKRIGELTFRQIDVLVRLIHHYQRHYR